MADGATILRQDEQKRWISFLKAADGKSLRGMTEHLADYYFFPSVILHVPFCQSARLFKDPKKKTTTLICSQNICRKSLTGTLSFGARAIRDESRFVFFALGLSHIGSVKKKKRLILRERVRVYVEVPIIRQPLCYMIGNKSRGIVNIGSKYLPT